MSFVSNNQAITLSITPTNMLSPPITPVADPTHIPVTSLESVFDSLFCQLNFEHNVDLNSPRCQQLINYVASQAATGHFNVNNQPIINNPASIIDVSFEKVNYDTTVSLPSGPTVFHVSGGLLLPNTAVPGDASTIKGVIIYFQGNTT